MQRTYMEIVAGSARYDAQASLKTWLYGVVRNVAYSHFRAERRGLRLLSRLRSLGTNEVTDQIVEPNDQLTRALEKLPTRQREVLELVVYRDFTLEDCAKILGIGVGSIRTHYHRAKQSLRSELEMPDES